MRYNSAMQMLGRISAFPEYTGERVYMRPFYKADGLPVDLSRWQGVVNDMLNGVDTDLPIYIMIDQAELKAGQYHRRAGLHIDGYWGGDGWKPKHTTHRPTLNMHGSVPSGGRSHGSIPDSVGHMPAGENSISHRPGPKPLEIGHGGMPGYSDYPETWGPQGQLSIKKRQSARKKPTKKADAEVTWGNSLFDDPEAIILASNVEACRAVLGEFEGPIGDGGNCESVAFYNPTSLMMQPNHVYAGNVTLVHETTPVPYDCMRTVVRLNVPGWHPEI